MRLHPHKAQVTPVAAGLDWLGYRVYPGRIRLRNDNGHRFVRKLPRFAVDYAAGRLDWIAASEGEKVQRVINEMTETLRALGPLEMTPVPMPGAEREVTEETALAG